MGKTFQSNNMSQQKIAITFILPSLVAGGAERVLSYVAQHLNKKKFDVSLVVFGFEKDKAYSTEGINVTYFNKPRVLSGIPNLLKYLLKNKPNIVVSCMDHVNIPVALILLLLPKTKLVTREANIKSVTAIYYRTKNSWFSRLLLNKSYKRTNKIVCQSKDMADEMAQLSKVDSKKLVVINNPISDGFKMKDANHKNKITSFITVGRLHSEKGHKRILNVLSQLKFPFIYTIIGTGEERDSLNQLVGKLKLESKVNFIPFSNKIQDYLSKSDLFLQGSYAEGFPNALLESCAVGTPVLAFKAPGGTSEIIEHGLNGYIASNEKEYLYYINLLNQKNNLKPERIRESVYKKFNKDTIIQKYENLFLLSFEE